MNGTATQWRDNTKWVSANEWGWPMLLLLLLLSLLLHAYYLYVFNDVMCRCVVCVCCSDKWVSLKPILVPVKEQTNNEYGLSCRRDNRTERRSLARATARNLKHSCATLKMCT